MPIASELFSSCSSVASYLLADKILAYAVHFEGYSCLPSRIFFWFISGCTFIAKTIKVITDLLFLLIAENDPFLFFLKYQIRFRKDRKS